MRLVLCDLLWWTFAQILIFQEASILLLNIRPRVLPGNNNLPVSTFEIPLFWYLGDLVPHCLKDDDQGSRTHRCPFRALGGCIWKAEGKTDVEEAALLGRQVQLVVIAEGRILKPCPYLAGSPAFVQWQPLSLAKTGCAGTVLLNLS